MDEILLAATLSKYATLYGPKLLEIALHYESLQGLYRAYKRKRMKGIPNALLSKLSIAWDPKALTAMRIDLEKFGIRGLVTADADYPLLLSEIPDKPYVLYVKGDCSALKSNILLSCVGTRTMTLYGKRAVEMLLSPLKDYPICLVSGLALGIDGEVHRIAVKHGMKTIAVLGGGLDRYEPLTNASLAASLLVNGCLVSEYPPGVRPQKHHFLARNRIIAGLSSATIVIEGKAQSGSLVTARNALAYGREVGVVPGDIFVPTSEGPLMLMRDGAWPVMSHNDILAIVGLDAVLPQETCRSDGAVYMVLRQRPSTLDAIRMQLNLTVQEIQQEITALELQNRIDKSATGEYYITH